MQRDRITIITEEKRFFDQGPEPFRRLGFSVLRQYVQKLSVVLKVSWLILRDKAITFEKASRARAYLILDEEALLTGR